MKEAKTRKSQYENKEKLPTISVIEMLQTAKWTNKTKQIKKIPPTY